MATLTADRAAAAHPVYTPLGSGSVAAAYGVYELTSNPSAGDIIEMCKVPDGAKVIYGVLFGDDIDTGTETLDIDVGWTADPDGLGNLGVSTGDAVTGYKPETGIMIPLFGTLKDGPVAFTSETTIQLTVNAAAATGGTGTLYLVVFYLVD